MTNLRIERMDTLFKFITSMLLVISFSSVQTFNISSQQSAEVVRELKLAFHAKCVFLVVPDTYNLAKGLASIKQVYSKLTHVSVVNLKTFKENVLQFRCRENRPLFVLTADKLTQEFFKEPGVIQSYPRWLLFADSTTSVSDYLYQVNIPFDCEFLVATARGADFELSEYYRVERSRPLTRSYYGLWTSRRGLRIVPGYLYERRNLQGLVLRTGAMKSPPVVRIGLNGDGKTEVQGFYGDVWRVLEQRAGFKTQLVVASSTYGNKAENGSWNGMVGMMLNNTVDVAINDFSMSTERYEAVDFLTTITTVGLSMVIQNPETASFEWNSILKPFSTSLWIAITGCIFVIGGALTVTHNVSQSYGIETFEPGLIFKLQDSLLCIYGLFCQQGPEVAPKASSCRCLYIVAGAVSIVFVAVYSATLTSFMTVQDIRLPFTDGDGFLKDGSYMMKTTKAIISRFEDADSEYLSKLYEKHMKPFMATYPDENADGLEWLCSGEKRVFVTAPSYLFKIPGCTIVPLPEKLLRSSISMIIAKGSPYRRILNFNLQKLRNTGVLRRMFLIAWPPPLSDAKISFPEVSLLQALPIFGVVGIGVVVGALGLAIEKAVAQW